MFLRGALAPRGEENQAKTELVIGSEGSDVSVLRIHIAVGHLLSRNLFASKGMILSYVVVERLAGDEQVWVEAGGKFFSGAGKDGAQGKSRRHCRREAPTESVRARGAEWPVRFGHGANIDQGLRLDKAGNPDVSMAQHNTSLLRNISSRLSNSHCPRWRVNGEMTIPDLARPAADGFDRNGHVLREAESCSPTPTVDGPNDRLVEWSSVMFPRQAGHSPPRRLCPGQAKP